MPRQKMVLNVAEKPTIAKGVSTILGRGNVSRREGFSKYNKVFEFNYTLNGQNARMLFTSVSGHLMEQNFKPQYKWGSGIY